MTFTSINNVRTHDNVDRTAHLIDASVLYFKVIKQFLNRIRDKYSLNFLYISID